MKITPSFREFLLAEYDRQLQMEQAREYPIIQMQQILREQIGSVDVMLDVEIPSNLVILARNKDENRNT